MPDDVKHTPGPWFIFPNTLCVGGPYEGDPAQGTAGVAMCAMRLRPPEECAANIRLIAAAPELLALCKEAEHLMPYIPAENFDGHAAGFFRRLAEAIKKADGAA